MRSSVFFPLKGLSSLFISLTNLANSEQPDKDIHSNKMSKNIPNFFKLYPPTNSNLPMSWLYQIRILSTTLYFTGFKANDTMSLFELFLKIGKIVVNIRMALLSQKPLFPLQACEQTIIFVKIKFGVSIIVLLWYNMTM